MERETSMPNGSANAGCRYGRSCPASEVPLKSKRIVTVPVAVPGFGGQLSCILGPLDRHRDKLKIAKVGGDFG